MKNIFNYIILILICAFSIYACTVKTTDSIAPASSSSSQTLNLNTLPGNNYFTTSLGGFSLILYGNTLQTYTPTTAKYDLTNGIYTLTLKSNSNQGAFASVYFLNVPSDSATLTIASYNQSTLSGLNAWATITTLSNGKTWRAIDGKLKLTNLNSTLKVKFDSVTVENVSAVTDTTVLKASATIYNK